MEPVSGNNEDDSGFQQFIENQFEMLMQNLEQYENTTIPPYSGDPINVEDLIKSYFTNDRHDPNTPQDTQNMYTTLLQDSEEFENTMLPPCQIKSMNVPNFSDWDSQRVVQDGEMVTQNGTGEAEQFVMKGSTFPSQNANVTNHMGGGGGMAGSFINYANVTTYSGVGSGGGGTTIVGGMAGSFVKYSNMTSNGGGSVGMVAGSYLKYRFFVGNSSGMNALRQMGQNVIPKAHRRRKKRKYKGVYETEAETTVRLERQKIKNRETAARAVDRKQAREIYLKAQIEKLRNEIAFRKKMLTFLEEKPIDTTPRRLKRTLSSST